MADIQPAAQEAPVPFYKTVKRVSATALSDIFSMTLIEFFLLSVVQRRLP
jgi:hypothetical protein